MFPEQLDEIRVCVVGLGYVGLPLAVQFGKTQLKILGVDINEQKIEELKNQHDAMGEVSSDDLATANIEYSSDPAAIKSANFIITAIPTPVDDAKKPDLALLEKASATIGDHISPGSVVVFESTVYPGVTEEVCLPIIEKHSGLKCGQDWKIGYSPERVNPGDKKHTIDKITKVVSGMDEESAALIADVYSLVCKAGVHKAPNIKTAEAAKVIENVQRDLNIALVNELALIFHKMGINTTDVLEAAGTKWNFHPYRPGLVGGHCIGVDPYYLTYRAEQLGYHPQIILAGRRINDGMADHVADFLIQGLSKAGRLKQGARVLIFGVTFKENVPDYRNSKTLDLIKRLQTYGVEVLAYDPYLPDTVIKEHFHAEPVSDLESAGSMDGLVFPIIHREFETLDLSDFQKFLPNGGVIFDVKAYYRGKVSPESGLIYYSL